MIKKSCDREDGPSGQVATTDEVQQLLSLTEELGGIGHWRLDIESRELFWSDEAYRLHGVNTEDFDLHIESAISLLHPDDRKKIRKLVDNAEKHGEDFSAEVRIVPVDGDVRTVWSAGRRMFDKEGRPSVFGIFKDITTTLKAQRKIAGLQTFFEESYEGYWDWYIQDDDEYISPGFWEVLGYSSVDIAAREFTWKSVILEEDLKGAQEAYHRHIESFGEVPYVHEGRYRHKDGSIVTILCRGKVIEWDEYQTPVRLIGVHTDLTSILKAQDELKESQQRFANATEYSPIGMALVSTQGEWLQVNKALCSIVGYSEEGLLKTDFRSITHPEDVNVDELYMKDVLAGKLTSYQIEKRYFHKDGHVVWINLSASLMRSSDGQPQYFIAQIQDISDRKLVEEKMAEYAKDLEIKSLEADEERKRAVRASEIKSQFLANMSHEIRTPMNGILGMTNLLLKDDISSSQKERLEVIQNCGESLMEIINDILDISKIEAAKLSLENKDFNLHTLITDIVVLLRPRAHEKDLGLYIDYSIDTPQHIVGDPGRIRQILMNLVGNAIKFTEEGHITVHVEARDTRDSEVDLLFEVQDTGIGIPEDKHSIIFDIFSQVDSSTTKHFSGTGLGLAICRKLVTLMGGEIGVTSKEGQGANFWFNLTVPPGEAKDSVYRSEFSLKHVPVLIADDQKVSRNILCDIAESEGMYFDIAYSGRQALEEIKRNILEGHPYSLVLFSCPMIDMNEEEFAKALQTIEGAQNLSKIALSSLAIPREPGEIESLGYDGYLIKPFHDALLAKMMSVIMEAKQNYQKLSMLTSHSPELAEVETEEEEEDEIQFEAQVLLVEDNGTNQMVVEAMLESIGCTIDIAENGVEAVQMYGRKPYDIIFMDCLMPEMNGYDATAEIRKGEGSVHHTIVALTANALANDRRKCLDAGMDDYLAKPVDDKDLRMMLKKWLPKAKCRKVA